MKKPSCSVCETVYDEEERCPLLMECGHGFCKDCLTKMFSTSPDTRLSCPRCRHVSTVGNSVLALRKNFPILSLLRSDHLLDGSSSSDDDVVLPPSTSWCCSSQQMPLIELNRHRGELRLLKRIGNGRRAGVEVWSAVLGGKQRRCRHRVAVKKVSVISSSAGAGEEMDLVWVQSQLESLRRASMWCRNVCKFHGAIVTEEGGCLSLVMDKCVGSVQTEMLHNHGRLTLQQILRYGADIARGVAELHAAGIVCMNIKPSNLLLDENGRAMVSDYGLAAILKKPFCRKARLDCESSRIHSCMDCTMLSPNYTAPEAWEPVKKSLNLFWEDAIGISAESDAWSFGCTLVEMCTGSIPWSGLSAEEIYRAVVKARKQPPQYASVVGVGIPRDLWKMIGECLQPKVSKRPTFSSMLAIFLRHLQEIPRSPPASPDK